MRLDDLIAGFTLNAATIEVTGITNDSRKVKKGDCFMAYPGENSDGRGFIKQALRQGAGAIVYEQKDGFVHHHETIPCIGITNLANKVSVIAARFYRHPSRRLKLIGITGTNGKTTVAVMLTQALSALGNRCAYIGTLGHGFLDALTESPNTTPDPILLQGMLAQFVQWGVSHVAMEVSSHALTQGRVEAIEFEQAIYTNLSHEHLDYHLNMAAYARAKARLFTQFELKRAIVNIDDAWHESMTAQCAPDCELVTYGTHSEAAIQIEKLQSSLDGLKFNVKTPLGRLRCSSTLLGEFNGYNLLAVIAVLLAYEVDLTKIEQALGMIQTIPGRMQLVHRNPHVVIDYSHTPDALSHALQCLKSLAKARLICVFGCGGDRDKSKRPLMGSVACEYADEVIITNDNPRSESSERIAAEILSGIVDKRRCHVELDRKTAIYTALSMAEKQDVVLVAGKGHENYQLTATHKTTFDDVCVAASYYGDENAINQT